MIKLGNKIITENKKVLEWAQGGLHDFGNHVFKKGVEVNVGFTPKIKVGAEILESLLRRKVPKGSVIYRKTDITKGSDFLFSR